MYTVVWNTYKYIWEMGYMCMYLNFQITWILSMTSVTFAMKNPQFSALNVTLLMKECGHNCYSTNIVYTYDFTYIFIWKISYRFTPSIRDWVLCKRGLDGDNSCLKFLSNFRKRKLYILNFILCNFLVRTIRYFF